MKKVTRFFVALSFLLTPFVVLAQDDVLQINIVGGNPTALPIAVVPMPYVGTGVAPETDIAAVIAADLDRSGTFRTLSQANMIEKPVRSEDVKYPTWRALKQDYLVVGRVLNAGDGAYRVEYELFDVAKQERVLGLAMMARANAMRDLAHQAADAIYEKVTGLRGAFWTRIAYVTQTGVGKDARYSLMVSDADGFNPQAIVRSAEPLVSPAWSPDSRKLAYVSFERGNSSIYIQDIATGARELVASFRGVNGAPAFSPDGRKLALTLSRSGNPEIYVMDLQSKALTQITDHYGIDTEPTWSGDGRLIYFTSDRGGQPQIYVASAEGGEAKRVTFEGKYNATATTSYDGKKMAVVQGGGNNYRIAMMDISRGSPSWSWLSPGSLDESPSFAPNASMVLYAAREAGRGVLYVVSADARVRQRLTLPQSDVREPSWSPYRSVAPQK